MVLSQAGNKAPHCRTHACITLSQANQEQLGEIIAGLQRFDIDQIELSRLRGDPADPSCTGVTSARYMAASQEVSRANRGACGLAWLRGQIDRGSAATIARPNGDWPCGPCLAGRRLVVIRANGDVLPCETLPAALKADAPGHNHFVLGELGANDYNLKKLLTSPHARKIKDYIQHGRCRCSFECAIFNTTIFRPWRMWRMLFQR